jgi:high-affinity K+ transport system ATPase subunit B
VPIDELQVGDRFVVRPGEKVATDGVVIAGRSAVDQSLLTAAFPDAMNVLLTMRTSTEGRPRR